MTDDGFAITIEVDEPFDDITPPVIDKQEYADEVQRVLGGMLPGVGPDGVFVYVTDDDGTTSDDGRTDQATDELHGHGDG